MTKRDVPRIERDWSSVTASQEAWQRYCGAVGLKFIAVAVKRVREHGETIAEAVNATIAKTAEDMRRDGAPERLVSMFVEDYSAARAHQMRLVADWIEELRRIDELPGAKTGPRKRRRAAKQA